MMFVILMYDVNSKRVAKVNRVAKEYLHFVQKSVFEGNLSQKQLNSLKHRLFDMVVPEEDSIKIYKFDSVKYAQKEELGRIAEHTQQII